MPGHVKKRKGKYPWARWFGREGPSDYWRGRDFLCQSFAFRQAAICWARANGHRVKTEVMGDRVTLTVTGRPPIGSEAARASAMPDGESSLWD